MIDAASENEAIMAHPSVFEYHGSYWLRKGIVYSIWETLFWGKIGSTT